MKLLSFLIVLCALLSGCRSAEQKATNREAKQAKEQQARAARFVRSVQVIWLDQSQLHRPESTNFQIYPNAAAVARPYKAIAMLSRNAKPSDEGIMITAIATRAKQLGADAMIIEPATTPGWNYTDFGRFGMGGSGEPIYRGQAIIYTDVTP